MKKRNNIFYVLLMVFASLFFNAVDMNGEDVFYEVICLNESVEIGIQACVPGETYVWTGVSCPANSGNCSLVTVSPQTTTTYHLETFSPENGSTGNYIYYVIVIQGISLTIEENLTECMEERTITFEAVADVDIPSSYEEPFNFVFHFTDPDGEAEVEPLSPSKLLTRCFHKTMWKVPDGDADHKYSTPTLVTLNMGGHECNSDIVFIDVYELWIDYFRHADEDKDWKIVVGEDIEYNAIASMDCQSGWKWEMKDGATPTGGSPIWNLIGGNSQSGDDLLIPLSNMPDCENWDYFGEAYGTVNVSCTDGEGMDHCIYSSLNINCENIMNPEKKVKVFFDMDAETHSGGNNNGTPNWYCYWSHALDVSEMHEFSFGVLCNSGAQSPASSTCVTCPDQVTMLISPFANHAIPPGNDPMNVMYINGFWATNLHESWHRDHRLHNCQVHGSWNPPKANDDDEDGICDSEPNIDPVGYHGGGWEAIIGTDPYTVNSTEDGGEWAEIQGVYNLQNLDWAKPGSQW